MAKYILNLIIHMRDIGRALLFFLEMLSNELGAFMMRIVDGRFVHHNIDMHRRPLRHLHDVNSMRDLGVFAICHICNETCKF
jgi:hypothetical protein